VQADITDPIDYGITDLRAKVNATYARGDCWSVRYEDGVYKWQTEPAWIWSEAEQRYVPYIYAETVDFYQVQTGVIGARIYKSGYAEYYSPNMSEVRVYEETWEVQYYTKQGWRICDIYAPECSVSLDENCVNITVTFATDFPNNGEKAFSIKYIFRAGEPLKHEVTFTSYSSDTYQFRVAQKWTGIMAVKVRHEEGEDVISSATVVDSPWFEFLKENDNLTVFENQWVAIEYLEPTVIDVYTQGLKADFVFSNWTLAYGESLVIDPETYTSTPPIGDAYVYEGAPDTNYGSSSSLYLGDNAGNEYWVWVKFDLSDLPDLDWITVAELRLYCEYAGDRFIETACYKLGSTYVYNEASITWNKIAGKTGDWADTITSIVSGWNSWNIIYDIGANYYSQYLFKPAELRDDRNRFSSKEGGHDPQIYVEYTPPNTAPTNDACVSDSYFDVNVYGWVNVTVSDPDGVDDLDNVQIKVTTSDSKYFTLKWTQSADSFSEVSDPDGICTLDASGSTRVNIDSDTDKICFRFKIGVAAQKGYCSVQVTTTDDSGEQDVDTYTNLFSINFYIEITVVDSTHGWSGLSPGDADVLLTEPSDEDIDLTVSANGAFTIQVKGSGDLSDGNGHTIPLSNIKVHASDLASAASLTTSYQNVGGLENQARGVNLNLSFKLWITVPDNLPPGTYTYTLYVQGVEAS